MKNATLPSLPGRQRRACFDSLARAACWYCVVLALIFSGGCSTFHNTIPLPETFQVDVSKKRLERKQQIVESFERKRNLAQVHAAERALEQRDAKGAEQQLLAVLERDPDCREALDLLGNIHRPNGQQAAAPSNVNAQAASWTSVEQNKSAASLATAVHAFSIGEVDRAGEQLIAFAGDERRDERQLQEAATLALQAGQPALSAHLAEVGLQRFPRSAALYRIRGIGEFRLGEYSNAQSSLKQSLSLDNSHPLAYFLLGITCEKLGDPEAARQNLAQAAALDPRYSRR